jgi:hypothetical protein
MFSLYQISLRHLLLEQFKINFFLNHFTIQKNDELIIEGNYQSNIPIIKFDNTQHQSHLIKAELLHKSLGHVSYSRIRNKIGITVSAPEICKLCAIVKITKASFKKQSSAASKPFEELHLDFIGPISPMSHKKHCYILTIVDNNTRYLSAIPLISKEDVFRNLTRVLDLEAKRLGYYPSILHSDRGTEFTNIKLGSYCNTHVIRQWFSDAYTPQQNGLAERFNRTVLESLKTILLDSGIRRNLWNEVLSACTLTLNQVPTHRSNKSPYGLFKNQAIPLNFFCPIGNPVVVLALHNNRRHKKSKLDPRGETGQLIGFNPELKSYWILMDDNLIVNSKSVTFLNFSPDYNTIDYHDKLLVDENDVRPVEAVAQSEKEEEENNKDEEEIDGPTVGQLR